MNCETAAAVARQVERRVGRHGVATKKERAEQASRFLTAIASCGRKFFAHNGRVSRFEVDDRGRIWFVDSYRERRIYTHYEGHWRGFSEGGTLRSLVCMLRDYIRTGEQQRIHLGPWPDWICNGDMWGYGGDMEKVRQAAQAAGLVPSNEERTDKMSMCIYHGNCADGFGAAWVVRKALGDIDFVGAKYQEPPPDVSGKDVVMVDFSYKRPVLLEMAEKANSILILDHHKTSAEDLVDLPANVTAKFDMTRSGAMLTWEHFFPGETPPPLLLHIEDRDLWRFALQNTRQIQANVFSFPYDFQVWDTLMAAAPAALAAEGEAIERKHFKDILELLGVTTREMVIGGHRVPVANLPYTMSSDAGHEMAKGRPFAACYWDTPEGRVFSLRSNDEGVDVSEVAKQYGGGGHRNASGFKVSFAAAAAFEV